MEKELMGCSQCAEVVWKLECTEKEVDELKRQRREDAKANEKVVSIYATQEQVWFGERNRLRLQIAALLNQLGIFEKRRAEYVESLTVKIKELEDSLASKTLMLEQEENRTKELDEEVKKLEKSVAVQAEEHAAEAWKSKTAFVKLVSAHRQLEAELARAYRQVEASKVELTFIHEQKDEAVSLAQKLSLEVVKLRSEAEQNDEAGSQKNSIASMWYKHRNPRGHVKLRQTEAKASEHENMDERKYRSNSEQRHYLELNSLAEQLRLRDEKIEILHWRLLSTEIKSEQLRALLDAVKKDNTQLIQVNLKQEEKLLNYEEDLHYLKDRLASSSSSKESIAERKPSDDDNNTKTESVVQFGNDTNQDGFHMDVKEEVPTEQRVNKKTSNCSWKIDVHALGVFHKVKRLKQQLIMLEGFPPQLKSIDDRKSFPALTSLLSKQVCRYESLQSQIDALCNRMNEEIRHSEKPARPALKRKTREQIKALERYLQEALQLQRYMVASGQKLSEIQNGISVAFSADAAENMSNMEICRFACSMQDTLKEIQKGLEIQFSRIIGDLEGTLARDGMESYT